MICDSSRKEEVGLIMFDTVFYSEQTYVLEIAFIAYMVCRHVP